MSYKRVLLKLSGETFNNAGTLVGEHKVTGKVFVKESLDYVCQSIGNFCKKHQVCIVVGAGNIARGAEIKEIIPQPTSDHIGMLGTIMNGLALKSSLRAHGIDSVLMSSTFIPGLAEIYNHDDAIHAMKMGKIVIFVYGTGNPFVTTDSAAVLRAIETRCDVLLKATQVDGVYEKDPRVYSDAKRYKSVSYDDVVINNLGIMDLSAIIMAKKFALKIVVFRWLRSNISNILEGEGVFSTICDETSL